MLVQILVAIARHEKEVIVLAAGTNSRLVEIQKDSFMGRPDHVDWESQVQTHNLSIDWKEVKNATVPEKKVVPNK